MLTGKPGRHEIFQFMVQFCTGWFTKVLYNMKTLGGWANTPSNLENLKLNWHFICWDCQVFNIHSLVCRHQGRLSTTYYCTKSGKEIRKPELKDPLVPNVLAIGGNNHLNICLTLQANSSGGLDQFWNALQNTLFRPEQITPLDSGLLPLWSLTLLRTEVGEQR